MGRRHISQLRRAVADADLAVTEATTAVVLASTSDELAAWQVQYDALTRRDDIARQLRTAEHAATRRGMRQRRNAPASI